MKQFNKYITEKVNKKEFEQSLSPNANIQGGAEFEFIVGGNNDFSEIISQYEDLLKEFQTNLDKVNDYVFEYNNLLIEIEELEEEIEDSEDKIELNVRKKSLEILKEKENDWWNHNPLNKNYYDDIVSWIDETGFEAYEISDWEDDIAPKVEIDYLELDLQDDFGLNTYLDENTWFEDVLSSMNDDFIHSSQAPFKNERYEFDWKNSEVWNIEEDGSLSEGGIEITSPVKQVHELLNDIEDMFNWIDDIGSTDSSCGFHVHISTIKKNEFDPIKLLMFVEENSILKHFEDRRNNQYTSLISSLEKDYFTEKDLLNIIQKKDILKELKNNEKYMGLHIIDLQDNHVEFRYMGGTNYHTKFKEVRENIAKYSHWMEIATNPEYKRKEYLKKINRVLNKIKLSFFDHLFDYIDEFDEEPKWQKKILIKLKLQKKVYNTLKKIYKKPINFKISRDELEEFIDNL